ncbi:hypothetical protein [Indioceanicola profundi]|nr:hypothetical protein [Indioceanicola profundi]
MQPLLRTEPDIPPGAWRISRSGNVAQFTYAIENETPDTGSRLHSR